MDKRKGFTLIELLIVVAIIAILAAIAVPNFLEAQVRAKISRCYADMRTLATANTEYKVDSNKWIPDMHQLVVFNDPSIPVNSNNDPYTWGRLTTPIAYMGQIPQYGFQCAPKHVDGTLLPFNGACYNYYADGWFTIVGNAVGRDNLLGEYVIHSPGPDKVHDYGEWIIYIPDRTANGGASPREYDSSNGTVSSGDIIRWGP